MTNPKTVPGAPWRAAPYSSIVGCGVVGRGGMMIASIPGPKEHAEPIAKLVASVPDLLADIERLTRELAEARELIAHAIGGEHPAPEPKADVPWFGRYQALVSACTLAGFRPEEQDDPNFGGKRIVLVPMQQQFNPDTIPECTRCQVQHWPQCPEKFVYSPEKSGEKDHGG